jgi:hypothetical protein
MLVAMPIHLDAPHRIAAHMARRGRHLNQLPPIHAGSAYPSRLHTHTSQQTRTAPATATMIPAVCATVMLTAPPAAGPNAHRGRADRK